MGLKIFDHREAMPPTRGGMLLHLLLSVVLVLGSAGAWVMIDGMTETRQLSCGETDCRVVHRTGWLSASKVLWQGKRPLHLQRHPQGRETGLSLVDADGETFRLTALGEGTRRADEIERAVGALRPGLNYTLEDSGFGVEWVFAALIFTLATIVNLYGSIRMASRWAPPSPLQRRN